MRDIICTRVLAGPHWQHLKHVGGKQNYCIQYIKAHCKITREWGRHVWDVGRFDYLIGYEFPTVRHLIS